MTSEVFNTDCMDYMRGLATIKVATRAAVRLAENLKADRRDVRWKM